MENASKALIIAGAVLIAIVLISLGVSIVSSQKPVMDETDREANVLAKRTVNLTFEKYIGVKKGSEIRNLFVEVNTYNSSTEAGRHVGISGITDAALINPSKNYIVEISYFTSGKWNGYVSQVTVKEKV